MRTTLLFAIAGAALLAGCRSASFDPEDPAVVAAVDSIVQSMVDGSAHVDADRVLAPAGEDLTFLTGEVLLSGRESIRARFRETFSGLKSQQQTVIEKRVRLLSPDVAVFMAVSEGTYTDQADWTSPPVGIGTTIVFVREQGQWRARHAHQSISQ
jgi:uncharacterized protein (TIGR02246 family)